MRFPSPRARHAPALRGRAATEQGAATGEPLRTTGGEGASPGTLRLSRPGEPGTARAALRPHSERPGTHGGHSPRQPRAVRGRARPPRAPPAPQLRPSVSAAPRAGPPSAAPLRQRSPARIPAAASPFREAGGVTPPSLPPSIPRRRGGPRGTKAE